MRYASLANVLIIIPFKIGCKITTFFLFHKKKLKILRKYRFQTKTQLTFAKLDKILDTGCESPFFSWSAIDFILDFSNLFVGKLGEVVVTGDVLPDKHVGVLERCTVSLGCQIFFLEYYLKTCIFAN